MKLTLLTICAAAVVFTACNSETASENATNKDTGNSKTASSTAPEKESTEPYTAPDSAKMMQAWGEYMTPGEMHKVMASTDGTWDCDVTSWMVAGAPPTTSKATAVYKTSMGGLHQEGTFKGSFDKMPFEGKSVMSFNNVKNKFTSLWFDNMSSGTMAMEGDYDAASKTFTFAGSSSNFITKKDCHMREVVTMVDANTQKMEMYGPDIMTNKEYKTMEIVMKRKK